MFPLVPKKIHSANKNLIGRMWNEKSRMHFNFLYDFLSLLPTIFERFLRDSVFDTYECSYMTSYWCGIDFIILSFWKKSQKLWRFHPILEVVMWCNWEGNKRIHAIVLYASISYITVIVILISNRRGSIERPTISHMHALRPPPPISRKSLFRPHFSLVGF